MAQAPETEMKAKHSEQLNCVQFNYLKRHPGYHGWR
jgi:hypothetical protein